MQSSKRAVMAAAQELLSGGLEAQSQAEVASALQIFFNSGCLKQVRRRAALLSRACMGVTRNERREARRCHYSYSLQPLNYGHQESRALGSSCGRSPMDVVGVSRRKLITRVITPAV